MEVTSRSETNGRDSQNQGYDAVVDNYRCTGWTDPGCGPALKKKRQQPAEVSDKLPGLEEREKEKENEGRKRR